jgi:hypothetical protein
MTGHQMLRQTSFLTRRSSTPTAQLKQSFGKIAVFTAIAQLAALMLLLALIALPAFAQMGATGAIVGTVTDPQGAVVPGADVSITDRSTSTTSKTTTNSAGHFAFASVTPGMYDLKITKSGFQTAFVRDQKVDVGKSLTEDVNLPVGSVTQEVTVETTGTELQTMNATVGNTVSGIALDSLPSLGRDVSTFVTLQPGVGPDGSVAGTVVDQASFQLDGGNNTNDMDGSMNVYTPSFGGDPTGGIASQLTGVGTPTGVMPTPADSVEEFKVNTANQTADFNNSSGAQIQVVTKRGTNTVHGTVYEYYLDNNLNANTWDNNLSETPIPGYHYSRFGAALGGPIIPKEFLGGKTYLFGNYQGFRWPNSITIERPVPTVAMRNGLLTDTNTGIQYDLKQKDPRGIGINPVVQQLWAKYMPLPNDPGCTGSFISGALLGSRCDGVNTQGFKGNMALPQKDDFGVARLDHDFGSKWHFNSSYRIYRLTRATADQYDIGGFFPGDTLGTPTSNSNRPQQPWYLVAGLTTNISSNTTNDFHYSYLRNYWSWSTQGDPTQFAGLGGALEPLGEQHYSVLAPYNVNTQNTRTRFWDGQDNFLRDDITMLHGNHLFQFGGQYQRNWNYHQRTDNGGGINYYPVYQLGDANGAPNITDTPDMSTIGPNSTAYNRMAAAVLGIVTDSQIAFTRTGKDLALNPPLTPATDKSTIPYYNIYFSDSWHLKPNFTLTYGLGWTLEMPPTEQDGKQVILVDAQNNPLELEPYLNAKKNAALQGQVFNPTVGFSLIGNTANPSKYPYKPFYGEFSPRIAAAWSPHSADNWLFGEDKTVVRGGYGRIYGRLNGVDLVLVPLLGTGLIQPVQCKTPNNIVSPNPNVTCAGPVNLNTAFRIGVDGNTAPLGIAKPNLPQPVFPGINDIAAGAGESLDPNFRPNVVDSIDFTIQRQLSNRTTLEVGYIGRLIHHEYQPININAVPYMMSKGGQQFQQAYAAVETAMGCTISASACGANGVPTVAAQPFFEASLAGTGYCTGFANCTAAVVKKQFGDFQNQAVWDLWSALDQGGTSPGFNFGCSMLNCPIATSAQGQLTSGVGVNASIGHGNYHAGFVSLRMNNWRGLTLQQNFTYSKALGTGAFVQATSAYTADDPFDLDKMYGPQGFDRKFVYNTFVVYEPPFFKNQEGIVGRLLGGWNIATIFTAGSGEPLFCNTQTGADFQGGSGAQGFGGGDNVDFNDTENCLYTGSSSPSNSAHQNVAGGTDSFGTKVGTSTAGTGSAAINMFSDPVAIYSHVRSPILGIDTRAGGAGSFRGMPYWNMDLSLKKRFRIAERVSTDFQVVFTNVLNHNQFFDPLLDLQTPSAFGVLNSQGNTPRQMELGLRVSF